MATNPSQNPPILNTKSSHLHPVILATCCSSSGVSLPQGLYRGVIKNIVSAAASNRKAL